MSKVIVELKNINKYYEKNHVVKDLSLDVYEGEFLSMLGPSGCGKTTTLRMIAGFERADSGDITIEGQHVESKEPYERNVNTVFQSYALFPHMTVFDNVAYGLKMSKARKTEIRERVADSLASVRLEGYEKRYPAQLSGGQKQRVAIARAIINRPRVLLLDEPLGALDMKLRKQMQIELKELQKLVGITFIYVTHDQEEALTMSDRIAVMSEGILEQVGTSVEVYERPATRFVADFIGEANMFDAVCDGSYGDGVVCLKTEPGNVLAAASWFKAGELVCVSVRPEKTIVSEKPIPGFTLRGLIKESFYTGTTIKSIVTLQNGQELLLRTDAGSAAPTVGQELFVSWDPKDAVIIRNITNTVYEQLESMGFYYKDYLGSRE